MRAAFPFTSKTYTREKRASRLSGPLLPLALLLAVAALTAGAAIAIAAPASRPKGGVSRKLMFSLRPDRAKARTLAGQTLAATRRVYLFIPPSSGIAQVSFYLDDPKMINQPWTVARRSPYDLNGTQRGGSAKPFDLGSLADTKHTLTAAVTMRNRTVRVVSASFSVRTSGTQHYTRQVFDDEFSGRSVSTSKWNLYRGYGNAARGVRAPAAVSVDGRGHLVITASMVFGQILSGGLQQRPSYLYGHYEFRVRAEADPAHNMSSVVLLWPVSQNRVDGEADLYETLIPRRPIHVFLHDLVLNATAQDYFSEPADATKWHTVAVDWQPKAITVYLDGVRTITDTNPAVIPTTPHLFSMQLDPSALQPLLGPVHMYVDYVRIFQ
ncbi:MAG: glycoside hydrolase family 16 protein [Actinomycetota bacterium]|nr:glycoside hydrolase family 16 protein [Actinomycetota bacterium]